MSELQTEPGRVLDSDKAAMSVHAKHHCKHCGLALVEGRAYELGGYRWHVECFLCSVCGSQLDADTNMLVLGNGQLVCSNCSYTCTLCGCKIEDLAILTNDQAFCHSCFKCRNCKRRIDDLKYARTSQGIFCMGCHNALLARKSRRAAAGAATATATSGSTATSTPRHSSRESMPPAVPGAAEGKRVSAPGSAVRRDKQLPGLPTGARPPNERSISAQTMPVSFDGSEPPSLSELAGSEIDHMRTSMYSARSARSGISSHSWANPRADLHRDASMSSRASHNSHTSRTSRASRVASPAPSDVPPEIQPPSPTGSNRSPEAIGPVSGIPTDPNGSLIDPFAPLDAFEQAEMSLGSSLAPSALPASPYRSPNRSKGVTLGVPIELESPDRADHTDRANRANRGGRSDRPDSEAAPSTPRRPDRSPDRSLRASSQLAAPPSRSTSPSPSQSPSPSKRIMAQSSPGTGTPKVTEAAPALAATPSMSSSQGDKDVSVPRRSAMRPASPLRNERTPRSEDRGRVAASLSPRAWMSPSRVVRSPLDAYASPLAVGNAVPSLPTSPNSSLALSPRSLALRHKRSFSDNMPPMSPEELDSDILMRSLVDARRRVAELETELACAASATRRESVSPAPDELSRTIIQRRQTLAGLEAQQRVAAEELRATRGGDEAGEFAAALQTLKQEMQTDIEALTAQREALRAEVTSLTADRDKALEESAILNIRNTQLQHMNNELLKEAIDRYGSDVAMGPHGKKDQRRPPRRKEVGSGATDSPSTSLESIDHRPHGSAGAPGPSVTSALGALALGATNATGMGMSSSAGKATAGSPSGPLSGPSGPNGPPNGPNGGVGPPNGGTGPMVTILDGPAGPQKQQKQQRNRWPWRRPGKGLTRVFAQEVTDEEVDATGFSGPGIAPSHSGPPSGPSSSGGPGRIPGSQPGGQPMTGELLEARCAMDDAKVPNIVTRCIDEVEQRGMQYEGIYRKSGSKTQIDGILECFESGEGGEHALDEALAGDISAVTSALKQFLRYLADPIIPYSQYTGYVDAGRKGDLGALYVVIRSLPPAHYATLELLVKHLAGVASQGSVNLMTPRNLAVVFAPTLARDETGDREIADMQARNDATQLLIENADMFE